MMKRLNVTLRSVLVAGLVGVPLTAQATHELNPSTPNLIPKGHFVHFGNFADQNVSTDLAFWGDRAYMGTYNGFYILKIRRGRAKEISFTECQGNQGDITVWGDLLFRATNNPNEPSRSDYPRMCDGEPVSEGFEGIHIFDISDEDDPKLIKEVATTCGSHTQIVVPDVGVDGDDDDDDGDDGRVLIYVNSSNSDCTGQASQKPGLGNKIEIIEVPLDHPEDAQIIREVPLQDGAARCHDTAAFTADEVNLAVCASDAAANVFDITVRDDPQFLYSISEPGVGDGTVGSGSWHSATMTWDGEVIALGWEPGGGGAAECEATDDPIKYTTFFYDSLSGTKVGEWTLPRPQSSVENCTIHVYNTVPLETGRYVLVSGNYQSGVSVVDFTDLSNPVEIAFSDPDPIDPDNFTVGGIWSGYWYNGFIYGTDIPEGLQISRLRDRAVKGAVKLDRLNPQTQEFLIEADDDDDDNDDDDDDDD